VISIEAYLASDALGHKDVRRFTVMLESLALWARADESGETLINIPGLNMPGHHKPLQLQGVLFDVMSTG
jgi:hypothetical protein